jgi:hydroxymethylbilane synthase
MSTVSASQTLRLGTRGSMLARMQSQMMADALEKRHPGLKVELIICKTTGDKIQDKPLHEAGGKGLFTKELEEALLANQVDFAVHSFKDVPVTMPLVDQSKLMIAAVPPRADARDVLLSNKAKSLRDLPDKASVGTGSLRRRCQILAIRPDLNVQLIRGNIDTRIRKQREGQFDAVILAMAGLKRSGMFDETDMTPIPPAQMLPAAAQGALALQCRRDDAKTTKILAAMNDADSNRCVTLERALVQLLGGDCHSPIAAMATTNGEKIRLQAVIGARGGELPVIRAEAESSDPQAALDSVMKSLERQDAQKLLHGE